LLAIIPPSFSQVLSFYSFSEKSSKIKFLKKFQKNLIKFLYQKWGREAPGRPQGTCHATSPPGGAAQPWPRPPMVRGGPGLSLISSSPALSLSQNNDTPAQTRVLAALQLNFSISLLSPPLLLRFGAFVLRYVTPPLVQVEFCLVKYFLSILAL
jgi:hypothetical protein